MSLSDLETVLGWAADEGWNPGLEDASAFYQTDPEGFFVDVRDGAPCAAISVVNHSDAFAFLGLYICHPAYRGQGIGLALWDHAIRHAGSRTIGLDGVPAQQANYVKSGFVADGATQRFEGDIQSADHPFIRPAQPSDFDQLIALEAAANGYSKRGFLAAWLQDTESRKTVVVEKAGQIAGFATVRSCRTGSKIGPLVASDIDDAEQLIAGAATNGGPITIDVPAQSPQLTELCKRLGMTCQFETARMYRGAFTPPGSSIVAVSTLELG